MELSGHKSDYETRALLDGSRNFFQRCKMITPVLNEFHEPVRQFTNASGLFESQRIVRDQLSAHAERTGSCYDEFLGGLLIDAAGSDERNVQEGLLENPNVAITAHWGAGKHFNEIGTGSPCANNLGRRKCGGPYGYFFFIRKFDDAHVETVGGQELRARADATACCFRVVDASRPDSHIRYVLDKVFDYVERAGHGHLNLHDWNSASRHSLRCKARYMFGRDANCRHDADL